MIATALIGLACAGHLLVDLPVFMGPVVLLAGWLAFATLRQRRRERVRGSGVRTRAG